ncbi:ABC transporter substrate-binding protein [Bacillus bombysepticus]|uniref:ABC transporter substrate-binding protein n=1 Tax=Bacillus thuringiensis serovar kumamotoensis TaxID=132267 RepID=A0A9X6JS36_BACUK|nr:MULTISPECIES: ABC transporter substrate-binding protein [Bacillus cereus group]MEC2867329.1 ABC transporter substrate-binding protein [Bacillus cereus]OTZ75934.1 ABC transporter substrate-binding protein [Bacillus thuringiensis serovar kumamtoensis]
MRFWKPATTMLLSSMLVLAAGCSDNDKSQGSSSSPDDLKGRTITVGSWKGTEAEITAWDKLLKDFEKDTGIKVKKKVYNDYATQLQTDLIGNTAPDVFYVDALITPELSKLGALEPIDDYIGATQDFNKNDFFKPAYNAFTGEDGKQYGLPKDFSTLGLFYNKDLLSKAGFTPNDIPTEAEKFPAFLKKLQDKLPKGVTAGILTPELTRHMFILQANGTDITNDKGYAVLSQDEQISALQPLVDAYKAGLIKRPADLGQEWSGDSFGAEKAAIMIDGNWAITHLKQNFPDVKFGTKEVPTINGTQGSMMFTVSYSINANSKEKSAAWEFVKYASGKTGMKTWAEGAGTLPSRQSVSNELKLTDNELLAPFVAAGSYATPWQKGDTLSIVLREYNNFLPSALKGDISLKKAMKKAESAANKDIKTQLDR